MLVLSPMKEIQISEFKAKCLKLLKEISEPLTVSVRGEPLVIIYPYVKESRKLGQGAGLKIKGDIVSPSGEWGDW